MPASTRLVRAAALVVAVMALLSPRPPATPRHLVLISLDTLRADHLGAHGYDKPTSPVFDALARRGVLFTMAVAQGPATLPSHGALMTGQYPSAYGDAPTPFAVPPGVDTLAEVLRGHGFATWGFTDGGYLRRTFGLDQGFERYEDYRVGFERLTQRVAQWLATHHAPRSFLFVHTYDPHTPYQAPAADREAVGAQPWRGKTTIGAAQLDALEREHPPLDTTAAAPLASLYDADIRRTDRLLGGLLDLLDRHGLLASAVVVVLSDHGEEFFEHGQTQHKQLYVHPHLHVPLLFVAPGHAPARVAAPVELIDVLPTAVELLGLPPHAPAMGRSLVPLFAGTAGAPPVAAYSEGTVWTAQLRSLVTERHQLLYDTRTGTARLYDRVADPDARHDLAASEPEVTAELTAEIRRRMEAARGRRVQPTAPPAPLDARTRRELELLGYVE